MNKYLLAILSELLAPIGDVGAPSGTVDKGFGVEQDLEILREDNDDKKESKGKGSSEEETEEPEEGTEEDTEDTEDNTEDDNEEQEETDDEESDEEEEEEDEQVEEESEEHKLTIKGIKKDFPDFFKKHPEMKGVIFRERQFSELFATPQEAQQAARSAGQFQQMETDLMNGDSAPLIEAIKKANGGKNYKNFISNLLPNLLKVDKDTYYKVVAVPLKKALRAAARKGKESGDKNLYYGAQHLHNFIFDDTDLDEKAEFESSESKSEKSKEQVDYENKLQQLNTRDHVNYKHAIDDQWVEGVSEAFLDGLDPDNILSEWTKKKMVEEAIVQLNEQMTRDPRYMRGIESLWQQAMGSGYDPGFKTRIVNASLARAKQIIPTIRQKLRAEALNEKRRLVKSKGEKGKEKPRVVQGRDSNGKKPLSKKDMRGMSDLDIIRS